MTELIPKERRDSLGIDTLPRAIIFAIHCLGYVTKNIPELADKVGFVSTTELVDEAVKKTFVAQVDLTYNEGEALKSGFKLWGNINNLSEGLCPTYSQSSPSSPTPTNPIPVEPPEVDTTEKYLYWACNILSASAYPDTSYISYEFDKDANTISLIVTLPLNYQKSLMGGNSLEASINFIDNYATDPTQSVPDFVTPASSQYWGEPIEDIDGLKAVTKNLSTTLWVSSNSALYTLVAELPDGVTADDDLYVTPSDQVDTEVWKKGGTGQGTGGSGGGSTLTASQVRNLLSGLSGDSRLDAAAIKNLPSGSTLTASDVRDLLGSLTLSDRLDAAAIQNLPSTGTPGADGRNPEYQFSATHLQYRLVGDTTWIDLLPKNDLIGPQGIPSTGTPGADGRNPEYQFSATHLQYRLIGDTTWINLILKADLTGIQGIPGTNGATGETWNNTAIITANYQILDRDRVRVNTTAGVINLTCPVSGEFRIVDVAATSTTTGFGLNSAFLLPNTGQTVRGATSFELDRAAISDQFQLIGTNWVNVDHG